MCLLAMKIVFFLVFLCTFKRIFCQDCYGVTGKECCSGYYWNSTLRSCQPCRVGFNGRNCLETCVYPGYGRDCQMTCHCYQQFCSHINGCNTSNEELSTKEIISGSTLPGTSSTAASSTTRQYKCTERELLYKNSSGVNTSIISLTAISGLFLLLYTGLHCYMTKVHMNYLPSATSEI
ncbi:uncharacterized protein LOC111104942 [Crassostrea virginica]